ncbi:hypothetical protein MYX65_11665 [Acidobacteria bacterium AH-259-L09]|nr:hypothetical protein [Acidobacteria bacterium AH-259-L09]
MIRGELGKAISLLQEGIDEHLRRHRFQALFLLATESLAKAWERQGNFSKAIQVLEECSQKQEKVRAIFASGPSPLLWMRLRL